MKTNRFFWGLAMMSAAMMFASCEKTEEPPVEGPDGSDETEVTCTLSEKTLTFANAKDEKTFTVTSNADWKLEVKTDSEDKWITVDPTTGTASDKAVTVKVNVTANGTGEEREATLTVSPEGGDAVSLTVTQSASADEPVEPSITFGDTESVELLQAGGDVKFNVTANVDWTAVAVFTLEDGTEAQAEEGTETTEGWFSFTPVKGTASETAVEITVTATASNDSETPLQGKIVFTAAAEEGEDAKTFEIPVTQAAKEAKVVYANDFDKTEVSADAALSASEDWKNETVSVVNYTTDGPCAMVSNGTPSPVSGKNNVYFAGVSYLQVNNIAVDGANESGYKLSFSVNYDSAENFQNAFKVYVSTNGDGKWMNLQYGLTDQVASGWNTATATFKVNGSVRSLSFYFTTSEPAKYRIDDLSVTVTTVEGSSMDFSSGQTFGTTKELSVADFLKETPNTMYKYTLKGDVTEVNGTNVTIAQDGSSVLLADLDLNDKTAEVAEGDKLTVTGYRDVKDATAQMSYGVLDFYSAKQEEQEAATGDELFISEYVCTESGECYIEIYNPTDATITMSGSSYSIAYYDSENPYSSATTCYLTDNYQIPSHEVLVFCNSKATWSGSKIVLSNLNFDGNDKIQLQGQYGRPLDVLGEKGTDFGVNKSLRRVLTVGNPSSTWKSEEWEETSPATTDGLGKR